MTTLLSAIGRPLLISCMIPAIVFVTATMLIFNWFPTAPPSQSGTATPTPSTSPTQTPTLTPTVQAPQTLTPTIKATTTPTLTFQITQTTTLTVQATTTPTIQATTTPTVQATATSTVQITATLTPTTSAIGSSASSPQSPSSQEWLSAINENLGALLAIILIISFMLAYLLMISKSHIVRFYEGYGPVPFRKHLITRETEKKSEMFQQAVAQKKKLKPSLDPILYQHEWRIYIEIQNQLTTEFPDTARDILPFRLGNIHRAFEDYSFSRYGIDGLFFWPRLVKVIPADYAAKIEEQNNALIFLLNSSLISGLIFLETSVSLLPFFTGIVAWKFIVIPFCLLFSFLFYCSALSTARTYGHYIRTSYDFFRLALLKELHVDPPTELGGEEERTLWRSVHEFLVLGEGTPYQSPTQTRPPSISIRSTAKLLRILVELICWDGLVRVLERLSFSAKPSQANTSITISS